MPKHSIGINFSDDAGSVPITPLDYIVDSEVNSVLQVPAGATALEFDVSFARAKVNDYALMVGTQTAAQIATGKYSEAPAGQLIVNVNTATFGGIAAPGAPAPTTATSGGTVLAGTYGAIVTYVNAQGETTGSVAGTVTTTGSTSTITVPSPSSVSGATGWYAYVTQAGGSTYTRQQAAGSPTAIGTGLTLTAPPTSTGTAVPGANTTSTNPQLIVNARAAHGFAPNIPNSVNQFTSDVSKFFITNPGQSALVLVVKVGLNL